MDQLFSGKKRNFENFYESFLTDMTKTAPEIHELRKRLEEQVRRKMKTPNDFIFLSGVVWDRTHETLSPTTLKRLWGYIDGADQTRASTLDILSRALGFQDWEGFLREIGQDNGSDAILSPHLYANQLSIGDKVYVSWKPNRRCTFRYLGEARFVVEKAENSKLKEGDNFSASLFILGEPLYLNNLIQGSNPPVAFVVGNNDGLCELKVVTG